MSQQAVSADEARHQLYEIMSRDAAFEEKAMAALELGISYLRVDSGFLTRIDADTDHWETIVSTDDTDGAVPPGTTMKLSGSYCRHTLERHSPLALHDTVEEGYLDPDSDGFHCYHGTTIVLDEEPYGTVCFVGEDPRDEPFTEAETMFAELVGRLLEHELSRKRQEDELKRQTSLVNVLDRVLRHNIRNEMTVVRANARLHGEKHDSCDECEKIVESADELIGMSETARHLGKILNSELDRRPTDIVALSTELGSTARSTYPSLSISIDAPDRVIISALPSLETALWELIENAAEHAGPDPTVEIRIKTVGDSVTITVADDGPGLPESERDVLQTGTETPLAHGSGLGLWSVYWVATAHSGTIEIETTDGTTVTMTIPRAAGNQAGTATRIRRAGDRYQAAFSDAGISLAIIDDENRLIDVNDATATLFDTPSKSLLGRSLDDLFVTPVDDSITKEWEGTNAIQVTDGENRQITYTVRTDIVPGLHLLELAQL